MYASPSTSPPDRLTAIYHVACDAADITSRASAIAIEQSVELPLHIIRDRRVLSDIVGDVSGIRDLRGGVFEVRVALASATTGGDAGQLMNMLFGNSSIHEDVTLADVEFPEALARSFGGPGHGIDGLRARVHAGRRALTCTALKPQGLAPDELAELARRLALGRIDYIKDDHGLADQPYSPFAKRMPACAKAVAAANVQTGAASRYVPNITGDLERMRAQVRLARDAGCDTVMTEPMIAGVSNFHRLTRDFPDMAFIAHPALAGASRIHPPLLLGKLFRLFGADATIFPNTGGRFGYTSATCGAIAEAARSPWHSLNPCLPTPAGGMTLDRVPELLDSYGADTMLLIGGGLLAQHDRLSDAAREFTDRVAEHERQHV